MKKSIRLFVETVLFIIIVIACFFAVSNIVERKDSYIKYHDFFDNAKEDKIDVLFMGSSHVINGINPIQLYEDYGYTSYNMGGHGSILPCTYWELIEALDYCTPKCVVVDAYLLERDYKYIDEMYEGASENEIESSISNLHLNMDVFPLNKLKIAAINDLVHDQTIRNEFLFDFIVYHNRWDELSAEDLETDDYFNSLMGAELLYNVESVSDSTEISNIEIEGNTICEDYLRKIIDECQRDGIEVAVTYIPYRLSEDNVRAYNSAKKIASEYGVGLIDCYEDSYIIDFQSDMNDTAHLNNSGNAKITSFVGKWLQDNVTLEDHRGDEAYIEWDAKVDDYRLARNEVITSGEYDIYTVLNSLNLSDYSYILYINSNETEYNDSKFVHLIANLSGTDTINYAANNNQPYIYINDRKLNKSYEASGSESLLDVETSLGTLTYEPVNELYRQLYINGNTDENYLYSDSTWRSSFQLIIYDENGEIVSRKAYEFNIVLEE